MWWFFGPIFIITIIIDNEQRNRFLSIFKRFKCTYQNTEITEICENAYNSLLQVNPDVNIDFIKKM
jgi:hypothetical protein